MGFIRLIFSLLLIPAVFGFTQILYNSFCKFWQSCFTFTAGILAYTLIYPVFTKPFRSYVIGHELTHVLSVWLFRGNVYKFKINKNGGMVTTDKTNTWISLAPYFFPIYTIAIIGLYLLVSIAWDLSRYNQLIMFILGFTWAFHFWMTINVILKSQPDIMKTGVIFSFVIIYIINVFVLTLLIAFVSPEFSIGNYLSCIKDKMLYNYIWIAERLT